MPVLVTFFDPEQLKDPAQMTSSMATMGRWSKTSADSVNHLSFYGQLYVDHDDQF